MAYYPAASVNLTVRWEAGSRRTSADFRSPLPLKLQSFSVPTAGPTPPSEDSVDLAGLQPRKLVIECNDVRTADEIKELELDGRDFPFDARTAREVEVAAFLGQRQPGKPFMPSADDLLFVGFLDRMERRFGREGVLLHAQGRDYTSLFLDTPYPLQNIPVTGDLRTVLERLVHGKDPLKGQGLPGAAKIEIVIMPGVADVALGQAAPRPPQHRNPLGSVQERKPVVMGEALSKPMKYSGMPVPAHHNYWDVVQEICDGLGLVAFMVGNKLVVTTPRNLSERSDVVSAPNFVWGLNIEKLEVKKNIGRFRAPNIQVVSHVPGRKVIYGNYPDPPVPSSISPTGEAHMKIHRYYVRGLATKEAAKNAARRIYEELTSHEVELELETREMSARNSRGLTQAPQRVQGPFELTVSEESHIVDLTRLRNGSPVVIRLEDQLPGLLDGKTPSARVSELLKRGYNQSVAESLAEHWDLLQRYSAIFRTVTATHEFDVEDGYRLRLKAVNYLNVAGIPDGLPTPKVAR